MPPNRLTPFQQEVLREFFRREDRFFLTGGTALAGYHLGHRETLELDPPEEILANKLCTLLSRAELRDLVDVWALEEAGYRIEDALPAASRKDGGLTPAQLAWVLSKIQIGEDARPPGNVDVTTLRAYLRDLVTRLTALARP